MISLEKLKEFREHILDLAIRGKLVEQRPEDGTAEDLYLQIQEEKANLIKEGKLKKEKPLAPIEDDEIPFDIPENWKWCKLGDLTSYVQTKNKISGGALNGSVWSLDLEDIEKDTGSILNFVFSSEREIKGDKTKFCKGNILYSKLRPYLRKILIAPQDGVCSSELVPFYCYKQECNLYLIYLLKSGYIDYTVNNATYGMKMPRVSTDTMVNLLVPLPPLAEQKSIVAKVENYLSVIEKAEELLKRKVDLDGQIKEKILQMAIQGKLVEQRPEEGTAEDLYQQIQEEKQNLIKEGKLKKEKPLAPIADEEIPFDIPENWKWARVGSIGAWGAGSTPSRTNSSFYSGDIPWLKTGDLTDGDVDTIPEKITQLALDKCSLKVNPVGSVLIAMYGATIGKLGILTVPATTNQACCACSVFNGMFNKYLFYFLMSRRDSFTKIAVGGAQPNISKEKIVNSLIPLPPLSEQKRIVAKVEELLALCDKLKLK